MPSRRFFRIAALQRRQLRRAALPWTGNIDAEIVSNAAVFDDQHAVGQRHGLGDVMGHQDRGKALIMPDTFEQPLHRDPRQRIERAERLVEGKNARLADQRARQRHALLLSA